MSLVDKLEQYFQNVKIYDNKTFNELRGSSEQSQSYLISLNEEMKEIINNCQKIVNMSDNVTKNPNQKINFIKDKKTNQKKDITGILFANIFSNKNKKEISEYWFMLEYLYMILFRESNIIPSQMNQNDFYKKNINKVFNFMIKNEEIYSNLANIYCGKNINSMKNILKKEFGSLIRVPIRAESCEAKFGKNSNLTSNCIQEEVCDLIIKKNTENKIDSENFSTIMNNFLKSIKIYYTYLGLQASYVINFIKYQLDTKQNPNKNDLNKRRSIQKIYFSAPSDLQNIFSSIIKQHKNATTRQTSSSYNYYLGGSLNVNRYFKKLDKIPSEDFELMVRKIGKRKVKNFLGGQIETTEIKRLKKKVDKMN